MGNYLSTCTMKWMVNVTQNLSCSHLRHLWVMQPLLPFKHLGLFVLKAQLSVLNILFNQKLYEYFYMNNLSRKLHVYLLYFHCNAVSGLMYSTCLKTRHCLSLWQDQEPALLHSVVSGRPVQKKCVHCANLQVSNTPRSTIRGFVGCMSVGIHFNTSISL